MGIFDFFKRKKVKLEEPEIISFIEVGDWIDDKRQSITKKHKQPKQEVNEILIQTLQEFKNSIEVLKNLDLTGKKAPERAKLIVKQNLYNFIDYLEKLILELKQLDLTENLDSISMEALINKINTSFYNFEKKSIMSFQKSTFLVGEELGKVREIISGFFKLFNKIINENRQSIEQIKTILIIEEKLQEIDNIKKLNSENQEIVLKIENKIKSHEQNIQRLENEISKIKNTPEYAEQIKNEQELEKLKTTLTIEFQALKDLTDFKALSEIYHSIEDKMSLIKDYKENFKETFEKHNQNNQDDFLDLTDIKQINQEPIKQRIEAINDLKENIENINANIKEDLTQNLEKEIQGIKGKIAEFNLEISKKQRLNQKVQENQEQIKQEIIKQVKDLNLVVGF